MMRHGLQLTTTATVSEKWCPTSQTGFYSWQSTVPGLVSHQPPKVIQHPQVQVRKMSLRDCDLPESPYDWWVTGRKLEPSRLCLKSVVSPQHSHHCCFWKMIHLRPLRSPRPLLTPKLLCIFSILLSSFHWNSDCIVLHYECQKLKLKKHSIFSSACHTNIVSLKCVAMRWVVTDMHKFY